MQSDSIISNTISQDIRQKGHQSIRFAPDGFSVLISDASYSPVYLRHYSFDSPVQADQLSAEYGRILEESELLTFEGETVFIVDSLALTVVPKAFFNETQSKALLDKAAKIKESDRIYHRFIKTRNFFVLFAVSEEIEALKKLFTGEVKIIHASECILSLADQVKSSDHQRGLIAVDVQKYTLDILVIQEDQIRLLNRYALKDPSDFIYYTLNTMNQLDLDRETIPIYLSGIVHEEHELYGLLGKYVRQLHTIPYYLEYLNRVQMLRFMLLSEGSKCV
ncbi:MAG: DUF3822 family protein [Bacteroidota bacterium]